MIMISSEPDPDDWLKAIDKHLEGAENAIQSNNLDLAEAELFEARVKLRKHQGLEESSAISALTEAGV